VRGGLLFLGGMVEGDAVGLVVRSGSGRKRVGVVVVGIGVVTDGLVTMVGTVMEELRMYET